MTSAKHCSPIGKGKNTKTTMLGKNLIFSPILKRADESELITSINASSVIPHSPKSSKKKQKNRSSSTNMIQRSSGNKQKNEFVCISCGKSLAIDLVSEHPKHCTGKAPSYDEQNFFTFKKQARGSESIQISGNMMMRPLADSHSGLATNKNLLAHYHENGLLSNLEKSERSNMTSGWEIDKEIREIANKLRESMYLRMEGNEKELNKENGLSVYIQDIIKTSEIILGTSNQPLTQENLNKITALIEKINKISLKAGEQASSLSKNLEHLVISKSNFLRQSAALETPSMLISDDLKKIESQNTSRLNTSNNVPLILNGSGLNRSKIKVKKMSECSSERYLGDLHIIKTQTNGSEFISELNK